MTAKRKPDAVPSFGPPCPACRGAHKLDGCDTIAAVAMLEDAGCPMSAVKVRERAGGR